MTHAEWSRGVATTDEWIADAGLAPGDVEESVVATDIADAFIPDPAAGPVARG
jgi:hypothetical protein